MDVENAGQEPGPGELTPRPPVEDDLVALCRELNQRQARYVVVGGFAIISAGHARMTTDVDLMVASDLDNESRVFDALATLPDNAVRELQPGELQQYNVIRVADEILVDLMRTTGGIDYEEADEVEGGLFQNERHAGLRMLCSELSQPVVQGLGRSVDGLTGLLSGVGVQETKVGLGIGAIQADDQVVGVNRGVHANEPFVVNGSVKGLPTRT